MCEYGIAGNSWLVGRRSPTKADHQVYNRCRLRKHVHWGYFNPTKLAGAISKTRPSLHKGTASRNRGTS